MERVREDLFKLGYYILGDSTHAVESFLLPLYDSATSGSSEDGFIFFHSSTRITVEYILEKDLRWGICFGKY